MSANVCIIIAIVVYLGAMLYVVLLSARTTTMPRIFISVEEKWDLLLRR